jgi:hypothetical protein
MQALLPHDFKLSSAVDTIASLYDGLKPPYPSTTDGLDVDVARLVRVQQGASWCFANSHVASSQLKQGEVGHCHTECHNG